MVKCADCGFLASRNIKSRELEETEAIFREYGQRPSTGQIGDGVWEHRHEAIPLCFARCDYLERDITKLVVGGTERPILAAIRRDRDCEAFTKWHQGFTPKEHREMMDRQEWRRWRAEREDKDREWRANQERLRNRQEWFRYVFLAVFTLLTAALSAAVTYWITSG